MPFLNSLQDERLPSKAESWQMFDRISRRYDLLNRLFSFGLDVLWRKRLSGCLSPQPHQAVLDVATGTADVLLYLMQESPNVSRGFGIDLAVRMLAIGRQKIKSKQLDDKIILQQADAQKLPFPENHFDAVTMAFGIRNMPQPFKVLQEIFRVLKAKGRALVLEFSLPQNRLLREIYLVYLRHIIPPLGAVISGDGQAYRYLNRTIETFPSGKTFCDLLESTGFKNVQAHPLTLGIATIYQGEKV